MAVVDTWRRDRCRAVAARLSRLSCLPALLQLLQRHLRITRRSDHINAVVLLHRRGSIDWWRNKLRNRERRRPARRTRSQGEGREGPRRKAGHHAGGVATRITAPTARNMKARGKREARR